MSSKSQPAYLIVNADDYGYFDCVSRGILEASHHGIVTATGIFPNSVFFEEHVSWLADYDALDLGVHLNLTTGEPLTESLRTKLSRWGACFPSKFIVARAVLFGGVSKEAVEHEWRSQIERCLNKGLKITFLNSHEHMHMLPPLFAVVQKLARHFEIPHVRFPTATPFRHGTKDAFFRDLVVSQLTLVNRRRLTQPVPEFLGLDTTGRLDTDYLMRLIPTLQPGKVYELMCHPGRLDEHEVSDSHLLDYHDWEGELSALTSPTTFRALSENGIQLVGYRHLAYQSGRLTVQVPETDV